MDAFQQDLAMKAAQDRHNIMGQFMHNFAKNMKMAVLSDSEGDMPEDERQRMMAELEGRPPPPEGEYDSEPAGVDATGRRHRRRHRPHKRMLNGGRPADDSEGGEVMLNGGRRESEVEQQEHEAAQEAQEHLEQAEELEQGDPPPRPHRRHMLNGGRRGGRAAAGGESSEAKIGAMKRDHAMFMKQLEECRDEDCIKQLYARQAQIRAARNGGHALPQARRQRHRVEAEEESEDSEDAPPPQQEEEEPREEEQPREEQQEEGGDSAEEEEPRPRPHHGAHPTVRDELGRPMPLLFGSADGAQTQETADKDEKSGAAPRSLFLAGLMIFSFLGMTLRA